MRSLRPFFWFYGGKWRDTPRHYGPPTFSTVVEPFAGSAGYSVRYPWARVVLCDIDPIIAGVWDFLIHARESEVRAIPATIDESVDNLKVCQEAKWLVGFWLNAGVSSPRRRPSSWMRSGARPGSFWGERVRDRIASQQCAIRHWRVRNCSYEELETEEPSTWFVDAPYVGAGVHYRFGSNLLCYDTLGTWCRELPGEVIVCENHGAEWLPFRRLGDTRTARRGRRSVESVWRRLGAPAIQHQRQRQNQEPTP